MLPPDRARADAFSLSLTSSQKAALTERFLVELVPVAPCSPPSWGRTRRCRRWTSGTGSASGTPCRCAGALRPGRLGGVEVHVVVAHLPSTRAPWMRSFIRFKNRRNVDLPQPDEPIRAVHLVLTDRQLHVAHGAICAVIDRQVAARPGRSRAPDPSGGPSADPGGLGIGRRIHLRSPLSVHIGSEARSRRRSRRAGSPSSRGWPRTRGPVNALLGTIVHAKIWTGKRRERRPREPLQEPGVAGGEEAGHGADQEQRGGLPEGSRQRRAPCPVRMPGRRVGQHVMTDDLPPRGADPEGGLAQMTVGTARSASEVVMITIGQHEHRQGEAAGQQARRCRGPSMIRFSTSTNITRPRIP